uniref:HECT domain-containing protein n=1 Tax=Salarias fasciatus TaxID=181472 RepID=A0A672HNG8_SALFA
RISLADVLIFATGLKKIPAVGFIPQPELHFLPNDTSSHLPKANTCSLTIQIPLGLNFEDFKEQMNFGIGGAEQFGEA